MSQHPITSASNPGIKLIRSLRQHKRRKESGLFIVEGIHQVGEVIEAGWQVESLVYSRDVLASEFAAALIERTNYDVQAVSPEVMKSLAEKDNPQGILAVVHQRHLRLSDLRKVTCGVALVSPQDPGNVGTVLRTMDAVGADALVLVDGGVDAYHPTCVRASMGSLFWKPVIEAEFAELMAWCKDRTIRCIGTSAHAEQDYREFSPKVPWMLVFGSEQKGLSADQLMSCDAALSLPMRGRASSLNLAVAAGILLYQFCTGAGVSGG